MPFLQVQEMLVTPPTQPVMMPKGASPVSSSKQKPSGATPLDEPSQGSLLTPAAVLSTLQQLQLTERTRESSLLCQELLADSSSGQAGSSCQALLTFADACWLLMWVLAGRHLSKASSVQATGEVSIQCRDPADTRRHYRRRGLLCGAASASRHPGQ